MFRTSGVYYITNIISGRTYIGSAANMASRWGSHKYMLRRGKHHSPSLQRSWLKHGSIAFRFGVAELVSSIDILIEREQFWINTLNSADPGKGFNICTIAGSSRGHKASLESRAKMSASRKGKTRPSFSAEWKANISAAKIGTRKGSTRSEETKRKISSAKTGQKRAPFSSEWREKLGAVSRGKKRPPFTPEHRAKLSAAKKAYHLSRRGAPGINGMSV